MLINNVPVNAAKGHALGRRMFFMHIPKTAGTSISAQLADWFTVDQTMPKDEIPVRFPDHPVKALSSRSYDLFGLGVHYDHDVLEGLRSSLDPSERRPFVFTIIREPRSRLVSQYQYWLRADSSELCRLPAHIANAYRSAQSLSLCEFLLLHDPVVIDHFQNYQLRYLAGIASSRHLDDQALLDKALCNCASYDIIGSIDVLDHVMAAIAHAYDLDQPQSAMMMNASPISSSHVFDDETEAVIADYISLELSFWSILSGQSSSNRVDAQIHEGYSYYKPHSRSLETLLSLGRLEYSMRHSLCGTGWYIREGTDSNIRWMGPGLTSTLRLPVPVCSHVRVSLTIVSVLDWSVVDSISIRLDGRAPIQPPFRSNYQDFPTLQADFIISLQNTSTAILEIHVPFTLSNLDLDPDSLDTRQKGIAFGDIRIMAQEASPSIEEVESLWIDDAFPVSAGDHFLGCLSDVDVAVEDSQKQGKPGPVELSLIQYLVSQLDPSHVSTVGRCSPYTAFTRGRQTDKLLPRHLVISSPEYMMQAGPLSNETLRSDAVILALSQAHDYRLNLLVSNPAIRGFSMTLGLSTPIMLINITAIKARLGLGMLDSLLWLIQRVGSTSPPSLGHHQCLMEHVHLDLQLRIHLELLCLQALPGYDSEAYAQRALQSLVPEKQRPPSLCELYLQLDRLLVEPLASPILGLLFDDGKRVLDEIMSYSVGDSRRMEQSLGLLTRLWPVTMAPPLRAGS